MDESVRLEALVYSLSLHSIITFIYFYYA